MFRELIEAIESCAWMWLTEDVQLRLAAMRFGAFTPGEVPMVRLWIVECETKLLKLRKLSEGTLRRAYIAREVTATQERLDRMRSVCDRMQAAGPMLQAVREQFENERLADALANAPKN